jgi:cell wall-associated NlpC family hydrolase
MHRVRLAALCASALLAASPAAQAMSIKAARDKVVEQTLEYLNTPYLWGGQHPGTGMDCSGFTQLVYQKAGLAIPRVARDQFKATGALGPEKVLPGDLIFFAMKNPGTAKVDHVGIYMGKGYFIHASVTFGIHVENISKPYYFDRVVGIRKFKGF